MPARIHAIFGVAYDTFPIDDEGRTGHAEAQLSIDVPLPPDAVAPADVRIDVRQQAHGQPVLVAKIRMGETFVPADAEHDTVTAAELFIEFTEFDGLRGTTGRVVLGIEIEHEQVLSELFTKIEQIQIGIRQFKKRSGLSCLKHGCLPFTPRDRTLTSHVLEPAPILSGRRSAAGAITSTGCGRPRQSLRVLRSESTLAGGVQSGHDGRAVRNPVACMHANGLYCTTINQVPAEAQRTDQ